MKKLILAAIAVSFIWAGTALAGEMGNVSGEVTKVEGEMVTVKMADGSTKAVHVDPKGTKKEGDIKVGAHVSADVTSSGHANWIKEMKEDQTGTMKK
jgi:hypothetical protein